jgi:hypothetical protein
MQLDSDSSSVIDIPQLQKPSGEKLDINIPPGQQQHHAYAH